MANRILEIYSGYGRNLETSMMALARIVLFVLGNPPE
jgi:hypothetical protein